MPGSGHYTSAGESLQIRLDRFPLTLVSRITGLVRELLIASTFGASA